MMPAFALIAIAITICVLWLMPGTKSRRLLFGLCLCSIYMLMMVAGSR